MNRLLAGGIAVVLLLGLIATAFIFRVADMGSDRPPASRDLPAFENVLDEDSGTDEETGTLPDASEALGNLGAVPAETARRTDAAAEETPFEFTRLVVKTTDDVAEACLSFSEDLVADGSVKYGDYLTFDPEINPAVRVAGALLCIGGLAFDKTYAVTLREGLPAASGRKLAYDEVVSVELRDRPAAIAFGSGVILPRDSADGIPVNTVNVDRVKIRVLMVGQRLLSQLGTNLLDQKQLHSYNIARLEQEQGRLVWDGSMAVTAERNKSATTLIDFREIVRDRKAGAYLILATDAKERPGETRRGPTAAQWVIDTDIGMTTYKGSSGLRVQVRSLKTAAPLARVNVQLIARNNTVLASPRTDEKGMVAFDPGLVRGEGGSRPAMLMAYGPNGDFSMLDLRRPALDLSDRGVSGRNGTGPHDAYIFLDRGIYRPGETVHVVSMLRDRNAMVRDNDAPLTLVVRRPDGMEYRRKTVSEQKAGSAHMPIALSKTAPRGVWSVSAYLRPDAPPVGRVTFDVQDFVPERLAVELSADDAPLEPGGKIDVSLAARFLYGAPAAGLSGEARLRLVRDPNPYPNYADYAFGLANEAFTPETRELQMTGTDVDGKATISGDVDPLPETSFPLRADITVSVFEPGGRSTRNTIALPIRPKPVSLGIRPQFEGSGIREGSTAAFDIVALDRAGQRVARDKLEWRVVREIVNYHWYQADGVWRYEREVRDRHVDGGSFDLAEDSDGELSSTLPVGTYRMAVKDPETGAASSVRFWVGWSDSGNDGRPDRVSVVTDKPSYQIGDKIRVRIAAPTAAKATLVVATDRVIHSQLIDLPADGRTVDLYVTEDWGTGAYVIVNAFRPLGRDTSRAPVRSVGLAWVGVDHSSRIFDVDIEVPDVAEPQSDIVVPVTVTARKGQRPPASAFVTLAAVDEGILQLTKFKSPNPEDHYFGKRRLAIEMRDHYGRLIRNAVGPLGELRFGGDALAGGGLSVVPTKTVAIFSGIVPLDEDGRAAIPVSLPDFAGELRLMASAFSATGVGQGDTSLTVRRNVVAELTLPQFLAPGDRAKAILSVHNVSGAAGEYKATVKTTGGLGVKYFSQTVTLDANERREMEVPFEGHEIGIGSVDLAVTGPADFELNRNWQIEVRPPQIGISDQTSRQLAPGAEMTITDEMLGRFLPQTRSLSVSISSSKGYNVPGLLASLDRYPYGCLEQTTSRAFPLLYFNEAALHSGVETDDALKARLQESIDKVLDMQMSGGAFGMWGYGDTQAFEWISTFALDFLGEAKQKNYVVPTGAYRRGLRWLHQMTTASWRNVDSRAYAFYVLARAGEADIGELRYFHDTDGIKAENAFTRALIAAALQESGDRARAKAGFEKAVDIITKTPESAYTNIQYGSQLRDLAGIITLIARADRTDLLPPLFERMDELRRPLRVTTTQEKAWMLFAADALAAHRGDLSVQVMGMTAAEGSTNDPVRFIPSETQLASGVTVRNTGDKPVWVDISAEGVPAAPIPASGLGMTVSKRYLTPEGLPVDLSMLKQNQRVVVVIEGRMNDNSYREMGVLDLLPAGWQIESVVPAGKKGGGLFEWMGEVSRTRMTSSRDDRFVAAFDIGRRYRPSSQTRVIKPTFKIAYVARTTVMGSYVNPAVRVEDMYAPRISALTGQTRLAIQGVQ